MSYHKRVDVLCSVCGKFKNITKDALNLNLKKNSKYICHHCKTIQCGREGLYSRSTELASKISTKLWSDPKFREKVSKSCSKSWSKEKRRNASEHSRKLWDNQDYASNISKSVKERFVRDPAYRKRVSKGLIRKYENDPSYKDKVIISIKNNIKISSQQNILYSLLDDLGVQYEKEYKIGHYLFDCFIPCHDLLIEVQGDYWHSLKDSIRRDKAKSTYIKRYFPNLILKYIWEHEFINNSRILNLIKYWLNLSEFEIIDFNFRDIKNRLLVISEAELFISKYHYAGRIGRSGLNLGFDLDDALIGVCILNFPIRQEIAIKQNLKYTQILELSRLAIHPKYQKKNLASFMIGKMIKKIKDLKPEIRLLVSFSDTTYNHIGTIYKASNWKLDGEVPPDYWYVDPNGYVCHKKTLWNKSKQMKISESDYCKKHGYKKVWGGKKFRYIYYIQT